MTDNTSQIDEKELTAHKKQISETDTCIRQTHTGIGQLYRKKHVTVRLTSIYRPVMGIAQLSVVQSANK